MQRTKNAAAAMATMMGQGPRATASLFGFVTQQTADPTRNLTRYQKLNLSENCIRRSGRAAVARPKFACVCLPVESNCAAAAIVLNCVWLKALYISIRNWSCLV